MDGEKFQEKFSLLQLPEMTKYFSFFPSPADDLWTIREQKKPRGRSRVAPKLKLLVLVRLREQRRTRAGAGMVIH